MLIPQIMFVAINNYVDQKLCQYILWIELILLNLVDFSRISLLLISFTPVLIWSLRSHFNLVALLPFQFGR